MMLETCFHLIDHDIQVIQLAHLESEMTVECTWREIQASAANSARNGR